MSTTIYDKAICITSWLLGQGQPHAVSVLLDRTLLKVLGCLSPVCEQDFWMLLEKQIEICVENQPDSWESPHYILIIAFTSRAFLFKQQMFIVNATGAYTCSSCEAGKYSSAQGPVDALVWTRNRLVWGTPLDLLVKMITDTHSRLGCIRMSGIIGQIHKWEHW